MQFTIYHRQRSSFFARVISVYYSEVVGVSVDNFWEWEASNSFPGHSHHLYPEGLTSWCGSNEGLEHTGLTSLLNLV